MTNEKLYEVLGDINKKHVKEAREYCKTRKPAWVKWGAMAACLCLVVAGAFAPGLQGGHGTAPQQGVTPGTSVVQPGKDDEATHLGEVNLFVVNEAENVMTTDMDVQFSHYDRLSEVEREIMLKQFETAIGLSYNDFTAKISDTFVLKSFYSVDIPADVERTEYVPHDYVFEYQNENDGEARIATCSAEEPLRDCFVMCDNPKQSEINGISAVIYGYQGIFMVEFSHENINYDIETSNITLAELEELLTGIMG